MRVREYTIGSMVQLERKKFPRKQKSSQKRLFHGKNDMGTTKLN